MDPIADPIAPERAAVAEAEAAYAAAYRALVARALGACGGNKTRAAVLLGVSVRSVIRWAQEMGL
jgi:transcriptional regulator with PAS, ATPase and Fis domain